ncbi:MAG: D-alanyl-D-alanine carboxypeptidase/D-alanyl-D-alanine-endopeptidase [Phycisphaeraceae bacterium]|nr:D-alanyl-D-alanine carboxypeptidase/D-alanyl-D-alanine-endopeptidase [Phycisphaeraceae bacterium]
MIGTVRRERVNGMRATRSAGALLGVACAVLMAVCLAPVSAAGASPEQLRRQVVDAIAAARMGNAAIAVSVRDCRTGREVLSIQPDDPARRSLIPASNLKLISSGFALITLGRDYEFQTHVLLQGNRLVIRGSGDPAVGDPSLLESLGMTAESFVATIVNAVVSAGATRIDEIVLDDRVFDRILVHPDWPVEQLNRAYAAPVSGLNFHSNVLNVHASPGRRAGDQPVVRTDPSAPWIEVDRSRARTVSEGNTQIWVEHGSSPTRFNLHGSVRTAIRPVQVTLKDPAMMFGRLLGDALLARGVGARPGADGKPTAAVVRYAETMENLSVGAGGERLVTVIKTPIGVVMSKCNVESDNLYAESLLKAAANRVTGQPGTWANGSAAVRMLVRDRLGSDAATELTLADGSGLSRANRVTGQLMTSWLASLANDSTVGQAFVESLPMAGREGTVRTRFRKSRLEGEVRAKSGYIREVRTLSGYVSSRTGTERLAFSVLINQVPSGADQRAKELHEKIVEIVDTWFAPQWRNGPEVVDQFGG